MLVPQGIACGMPAGLPPLTGLYASMLPMVSYALTGTSRQVSAGPDALGSTLVAIGVGALAQKQGRRIDANRELAAVELANIGGSPSQAYPVTGGISRSAVNARAGAQTQVSSLITAASSCTSPG